VIEDYEIYEEGDEVACDCKDCVCEPEGSAAVAGDAQATGGCACGGQGCGGGPGPVDVESPASVEQA
jgi:hypothetical protein